MNRIDCKLERVSNATVGLILLGVGLLFTLTGITVLPVIGLLIAAPVLVLAAVFLVAGSVAGLITSFVAQASISDSRPRGSTACTRSADHSGPSASSAGAVWFSSLSRPASVLGGKYSKLIRGALSGMERAIQRCVELILATAGGMADASGIRVGRPAPPAPAVSLRPSRVRVCMEEPADGEGPQRGDVHRRRVDDLAGEDGEVVLQDRDGAVGSDVLDADVTGLGHRESLLVRPEVVLAHRGHVGLRVGRPGPHRMWMRLGVLLDGPGCPPVGVPLTEHRVDGRSQHDREPLLQRLLFVVLGYLVGTLLIRRILPPIARRTPTDLDDRLLEKLGPDLRWLLVVFALRFATDRLTFVSAGVKDLMADVYFLVGLAIVMQAGWRLIDLAGRWYGERSRGAGREEELAPLITLLARIFRAVLLVTGLVMAVINVPQALANGVLAGVNPVFGLYSMIVGTTVAAFVTASVFMNVDSTSATALTAGEALAGVTRNGARALGLQERIGTLEPGKDADFVLWEISEPAELAYRIGFNPLKQVVRQGKIVSLLR